MGCSATTQSNSSLSGKQKCGSFHEKYRLDSKVGRGAFSQVRLAKNVTTGQEVAVKIIDLQGPDAPPQNGQNDRRLSQIAATEAMLHSKLGSHKHIVKMLDDPFAEGRICYIVLEVCPLSLWEKLESSSEVTESTLAQMFRDMFQSIAYVHSKSIVHRDIKPDNFLYGNPCDSRQQPTLKLCDFGLSAILSHKDEMLPGVYGTPPFMSPEILSGKGCTEKTDIWSMSIIAYVFLFGQFPYVARKRLNQDIRTAILEGRPPASFEVSSKLQHLEGPSSKAISFVRGIFSRDMRSRLSAKNALRLPFLSAESCSKSNGDSPSLKPMIFEARRCGAFEGKNLMIDDEIDHLLNEQQTKHHGEGITLARSGTATNDSSLQGKQRVPLSPGKRMASWDTISTHTGGTTASVGSQPDDSHFDTQGDLGRLEVH